MGKSPKTGAAAPCTPLIAQPHNQCSINPYNKNTRRMAIAATYTRQAYCSDNPGLAVCLSICLSVGRSVLPGLVTRRIIPAYQLLHMNDPPPPPTHPHTHTRRIAPVQHIGVEYLAVPPPPSLLAQSVENGQRKRIAHPIDRQRHETRLPRRIVIRLPVQHQAGRRRTSAHAMRIGRVGAGRGDYDAAGSKMAVKMAGACAARHLILNA